MRTTNHVIKKLITNPDRNNPTNSTGKDLVETVNGLIDVIGALQDFTTAPDLNVTTYTEHDMNYPYPLGVLVMLPYGFFRNIHPVPAGNNIPITDSNYWDLIHVPNLEGELYGGLFSETEPTFKGAVYINVTEDLIQIVKSKASKEPEPYLAEDYEVLFEFEKGGNVVHNHWKGIFSITKSYLVGDFVIRENQVLEAIVPVSASAFDSAEWNVVQTLTFPAFRGDFVIGNAYVKGDSITVENTTDKLSEIWVANRNIASAVDVNTTDWTLQKTYYLGGSFRGSFVATTPYRKSDVVTRISTAGETEILSCLEDTVGAYTPSKWKLEQTFVSGGTFRGEFLETEEYNKDDSVVFVDNGSVYIYEAIGPIAASAFNSLDWRLKESFAKPVQHVSKAFLSGTLQNNELLCSDNALNDFVIPQTAANSIATALTASSAPSQISIVKNGTEVGTILFRAGETTGEFIFTEDVSFVTGDQIELQQKGFADLTLADISITLVGNVQ